MKTMEKKELIKTNILINKKTFSSLSKLTKLNTKKDVIDFALKTTYDLLKKRKSIKNKMKSLFGVDKNNNIFEDNYITKIRGY